VCLIFKDLQQVTRNYLVRFIEEVKANVVKLFEVPNRPVFSPPKRALPEVVSLEDPYYPATKSTFLRVNHVWSMALFVLIHTKLD